MAYENLKAAIKQAIKQNGNQEITGSIMQSTLLSMADNIHEVVQSTGEAEDKVMSQKATSVELNKKADKAYTDIELNKKADKEETNRLLATKANTADVDAKFTEEKNRVDGELAKKFDNESIVQEFGKSENAVLSQNFLTKSDKLSFSKGYYFNYGLSSELEYKEIYMSELLIIYKSGYIKFFGCIEFTTELFGITFFDENLKPIYTGTKPDIQSIDTITFGASYIPSNAKYFSIYAQNFNSESTVYFTSNRIVKTGINYELIRKINANEVAIENINISKFSDKRIMFFGDSLVSNTSRQLEINGGFVRLIANNLKCNYNSRYSDDSPTDTSEKGIFNIAKDGTTLRIKEDRHDSICERVLNWCDNTCDLAVIQGGTNDFNRNFGTVSDSYDVEFDKTTTCGALETIFKHCTYNKIKTCFIIMHKVGYVDDNYYDFAKKACNKWGIPFIDLTHSAGFYMSYSNARHGELYSIKSVNEWNSTSTYNLDDKVSYQGKSYKCLRDNVTGIVPTNEEYWVKTSDKINDFCHLNDDGNKIIYPKILNFILSVIQ